jgi:hypothetical protein
MLTKVDSLYFWLRDHYRGLIKGECASHEAGYNNGWDDGFDNGIITSRKAVINKLSAHDPKLNNAEFTLGYNQAVAIVKGEI